MAATPVWKVYHADGEYLASVKYPEIGAMILAGLGGPGNTLRYGHHKVVWTEGQDGEAWQSYDEVAAMARSKA